jgi:peroxiredoxin
VSGASGTQVPAVGTRAPDFDLPDQHGQSWSSQALREAGKNILLVFYPFAFTGVCTGELAAMRDRLDQLRTDDTELLAVSCDSMYSLRVFAEREQLEFPLLSDYWPHGEVAQAFGVFVDDRGCALRGTFLIDRHGDVAWSVVNKIPYARDVDAYLDAIAALGNRR